MDYPKRLFQTLGWTKRSQKVGAVKTTTTATTKFKSSRSFPTQPSPTHTTGPPGGPLTLRPRPGTSPAHVTGRQPPAPQKDHPYESTLWINKARQDAADAAEALEGVRQQRAGKSENTYLSRLIADVEAERAAESRVADSKSRFTEAGSGNGSG